MWICLEQKEEQFDNSACTYVFCLVLFYFVSFLAFLYV